MTFIAGYYNSHIFAWTFFSIFAPAVDHHTKDVPYVTLNTLVSIQLFSAIFSPGMNKTKVLFFLPVLFWESQD